MAPWGDDSADWGPGFQTVDAVPGPLDLLLLKFWWVSAPMSPKDLVPSSGLHENCTYLHKPVGVSIPASQHTKKKKPRLTCLCDLRPFLAVVWMEGCNCNSFDSRCLRQLMKTVSFYIAVICVLLLPPFPWFWGPWIRLWISSCLRDVANIFKVWVISSLSSEFFSLVPGLKLENQAYFSVVASILRCCWI